MNNTLSGARTHSIPTFAEHYEREVDSSVDALTSVIEPILILTLGLVIGAILVAIYLPMFDLVTVIE